LDLTDQRLGLRINGVFLRVRLVLGRLSVWGRGWQVISITITTITTTTIITTTIIIIIIITITTTTTWSSPSDSRILARLLPSAVLMLALTFSSFSRRARSARICASSCSVTDWGKRTRVKSHGGGGDGGDRDEDTMMILMTTMMMMMMMMVMVMMMMMIVVMMMPMLMM
jgi:hypothetical protein